MVRLTRLRIDRFRNVKPGTELRFGSTFNVLLGKNATGKSTLLDLVAAVTNDNLSAYAKEDAGFDLTWEIEEGDTQMVMRAVRTPAKSGLLPSHIREEKEFDDAWTMVLRSAGTEIGQLEVAGPRGSWRPRDKPGVSFDVRADRGRLLAVVDAGRKFPETLDVLLAAQILIFAIVEGLGRFDEALGVINAVTRASFELSRESSGGSSASVPWLPKDFIKALDARISADPLVVSFDEIGSFRRVPVLLGFTSAELRPRLLTRSQEGETVTSTYQGFDCIFRRADGSQISHELLSFGQKRLFSFLWYLAVREELPVVADELLNGLHHEWIEVCFDRLRDRQSFLATQHPLLLDHIPIESTEAVQTTFIRCSLESGPDGHERMVWRNFNEEEAERFFVAYQTGIQQVSEVLRTEGLW